MIKEVFEHDFALRLSQPQRGEIVLQLRCKGPRSLGRKTASFNLSDASRYLRELRATGRDAVKRMLQKSRAVKRKPQTKPLWDLFFSTVRMCLVLLRAAFRAKCRTNFREGSRSRNTAAATTASRQ